MEPDNVLEIGLGHSSTANEILKVLTELNKGKYYAIDTTPHLEYLEKFSEKFFEIATGQSSIIISKNDWPNFDLVLVDATHTEEAVYEDTKNSIPKLNKEGLFVYHDANSTLVMNGIQRAAKDYNLVTFYFPQFYTSVSRYENSHV